MAPTIEAELLALTGRIERPEKVVSSAAGDLPRGRLGEVARWLATTRGAAAGTALDRVSVVSVAASSAEPGGAAREAEHLAELVSVRIDRVLDPAPVSVEKAFADGVATAEAVADAGVDLLVVSAALDPDPLRAVAACAVVGLLTSHDASRVTDPSLDDPSWIGTCASIRDIMRRTRPVRARHAALLDQAGHSGLAAVTGLLLGAAARRTPVLLDGLTAAAGALLAHRAAFRAADWWLAGDQSAHPAHELALARLSLTPVLDLGAAAQQPGVGLLALPLLRAAALG